MHGRDEKCIHVLLENIKVRSLGSRRCIFEDNTKTDDMKVCEAVDWMHLAQEREKGWIFVNIIIKLCVP
jgi:hypothetical protein